MHCKSVLLALVATANLYAMSFGGRVSIVSPVVIDFALSEAVEESKVGFVSHKLPFECQPALKGAVEYGENSLAFYTKELHKGINYTCKMGTSTTKFNVGDFELSKVIKIADDRYILQFNDEPKDNELNSKLKVEGANVSVQPVSARDFYINLDKNISEPVFSLPATFESKFGAKLQKEYSYKVAPKAAAVDLEPTMLKDKKYDKAKTLVIDTLYPVSLEDGKLAARLYLKDWLYNEGGGMKKHIAIKGIKNFAISDMHYIDYEETQKENSQIPSDANYYIDIISDEFKPQTEYEITIMPGFGDTDAVVREKKTLNVKMANLLPFVKFNDSLPYISSVGQVGFKSANVSQLKVVVEKLPEQNYRYFLNFQNPDFELSDVTTEVASKIYELGGALNETTQHKIKLDFAGAGDGVYKITAYYDKEKSVSKTVYLSDIAITAKLAKNEIFIFANRLGENTMLANANVKIYSHKNEEIAVGATNDEGVFKFNKKDIYKDARSVVVSLGKEQNFLVIAKGENINEGAKISLTDANSTIDAFTHFASNIIRPGEKIKGVSYLRDRNFKPLANMPVRLKFSDPQGKVLAQISKKTDEVGAFGFEEEIASELTGRFIMEVIYANKIIAQNPFFIESFVPARLKNEIVLSDENFMADDLVIANLSSSYLFGGAASGLGANLEISFFDYEYKNEKFKEYRFKNDAIKEVQYQPIEKQIKLDKDGKWQEAITVSFDGKEHIGSILRGVINFSVNDDGKNVSSFKSFNIFPHESVVGIAANKSLVEPNEKVKFKAIVLKANSDEQLKRDLKFELKRVVWDYTSDERGLTRWHSTLENVDSFFVSGDSHEYSFAQSGSYVVVATDPVTGASASVAIDVSGWDYSTLMPTKEIAKAQIKLNAKTYKKGDELSADISSAIKDGLALVTLEADGIKAHKVVRIKNNSANAKFALDFDFEGLYVSASIYRLADEGLAPFRTHAKIYARADKSQREMPVQISAPQTAKTNQNVKILLKTEPNADVSLFVADLGVLNITSQTSPAPLKFFDIVMPDGVFDYDFYNSLTGYKVAGKMLNFGGDMAAMKMAEMLEKHGSPVDKKNIESFVLMTRVKADANGVAEYEFKTPNGFNSAVRIDAIASNAEKMGSSSSQIVVKDDVIIKPSVLAYMLKGDEIAASLRLINTTTQDKNLTIVVRSSENLELTTESNASLKAQENRNFNLLMKAKELGKANYEISVNDGSQIFTNTAKLDIIAPYPLSTYAKNVGLDKLREFKLPKGFTKVRIDASTSVTTLLNSASKNLIEYPYGCAEQRSSRLLALLNAHPANDAEAQDRVRFINSGMGELLKMQKNTGQFGYWDEMSSVNPFASTYAADVLFELDKAGFKLDANTKKRVIKGIEITGDGISALYPLYVKAKFGAADRSEINRIYDAKSYTSSGLTRYLMAATLKMAGFNDEAKAALNGVQNAKYVQTQTFSSDLRDRAFMLYLHASHFEKNDFSEALANSIVADIDDVRSTQERAFVLRAIRAYFGDPKAGQSNKFKLTHDSKSTDIDGLASVNFTTTDGLFKIEPANPVFISISSSAYVPLSRHKKDPVRELDIYRTFVNSSGKELNLDELKVGDVVFSKVEVASKHDIEVGVMNEMTSSCFEAINENLTPVARSEATKTTLRLSYQTQKDDRVISFYEIGRGESAVIFTPYRVVLGGKCALPAVISENMYNETQTDYDLTQPSFNVK